MYIAIYLSLAAVGQAPLSPVDSLPLSLDAAIIRALDANPGIRAVRARADAAAQAPLEATRAFLPALELGLGAMRTTDPVGVFGLKLRQETFRAEDLSLDALNRPAPYGGYTASATLKVPVLVPEGLFGHAAARRAAEAQRAAADRMAGATTYRVIEAYWTAQLAARRVEMLDTAVLTARAHVRRAEALRDQGMVTGLDARLARVRSAELETQRLAAGADAANALHALAALLVLPDSVLLQLTDSLTGEFSTKCTNDEDACTLDDRADVVAAAYGESAASAAVRSAWGKNLPTVALFGSLARHTRTSPWSSGSGDWTVGFMVSWNMFQGLAGVGAVKASKADAEAARANAQATRTQAELEAASARRVVEAAVGRVRVASAALDEATTAVAQAELRYQQGQSPITELLDVQTAATVTELNLLAARRDLFVARAALDFAYGVYDR